MQIQKKSIKKAEAKVKEINEFLAKNGSEKDWIISDLPKKPIIFAKSKSQIIKSKTHENILYERDPVKISYDNGDIKLLAEVDNSIISSLQNFNNYIPNVFASNSAYERLVEAKIIDGEKN